MKMARLFRKSKTRSMLVFIQIVTTIAFLAIAFQDIKDKAVSLFLFPLLTICIGLYHYHQSTWELFCIHSIINIIIVSVILLTLYTYIRLRQNHIFFNVFGSGDMAMFYVLCFSFATVSFVISFVFSIIFSLVLSMLFYKPSSQIPLAGHMAIFFLCIFVFNWFGILNHLYRI